MFTCLSSSFLNGNITVDFTRALLPHWTMAQLLVFVSKYFSSFKSLVECEYMQYRWFDISCVSGLCYSVLVIQWKPNFKISPRYELVHKDLCVPVLSAVMLKQLFFFTFSWKWTIWLISSYKLNYVNINSNIFWNRIYNLAALYFAFTEQIYF